MSQENVEIVRRAYEAFNRRDIAALSTLVDPEIDFRSTVESHRGMEGVADFVRSADETLDGFTAVPTEIIDAGKQVVVVVHERGRGKGSGIEVDHRFAHVWTIRDGRAVAFHAFTKRTEALEAVGLSE
jgi:ketosteroid isomerase-like protein